LSRTRSSQRDEWSLPSWAAVTRRRVEHIRRVAERLAEWADALEVSPRERRRWLRAAALHDALKDAPNSTVRRLAVPRFGPRSVWHGPAAAHRAELDGERDRGVLAAVRYHTVGYAGWDRVGRMLYLADFLEPERAARHRERAAWARRVPREPDAVLREVARERIAHGLRKGWPLLPETVAFWNDLH
jgi:HD superfamily phosphohydrolase YqeK